MIFKLKSCLFLGALLVVSGAIEASVNGRSYKEIPFVGEVEESSDGSYVRNLEHPHQDHPWHDSCPSKIDVDRSLLVKLSDEPKGRPRVVCKNSSDLGKLAFRKFVQGNSFIGRIKEGESLIGKCEVQLPVVPKMSHFEVSGETRARVEGPIIGTGVKGNIMVIDDMGIRVSDQAVLSVPDGIKLGEGIVQLAVGAVGQAKLEVGPISGQDLLLTEVYAEEKATVIANDGITSPVVRLVDKTRRNDGEGLRIADVTTNVYREKIYYPFGDGKYFNPGIKEIPKPVPKEQSVFDFVCKKFGFWKNK